MFIRAYQKRTSNEVVFLAVNLDGPWMDLTTGKPASIENIGKPLFPDLEFLDWRTGRSRYDESGRLTA